MLVKTIVTKCYRVEMTEDQARDLLYLAVDLPELDITLPRRQVETLDNLREALLRAGLTKDPN